MIIEFEFHRY